MKPGQIQIQDLFDDKGAILAKWAERICEVHQCTTLDLGWWSFFRRVQGSCLKWNNMSQKITGQKCCRKLLLIILMIMWQNVLLTITITITITIIIIIIIVIIFVATVVVVIKNLMIIDSEKKQATDNQRWLGPAFSPQQTFCQSQTPCGCIRGPVPQPGDSWVKALRGKSQRQKTKEASMECCVKYGTWNAYNMQMDVQ